MEAPFSLIDLLMELGVSADTIDNYYTETNGDARQKS